MSDLKIELEPHSYLDAAAFVLDHKTNRDGSELDLAGQLLSLAEPALEQSPFELHREDSEYQQVKSAVRDLLRQHGYKPTGRGKPASEYLVRAVGEGKLGRINPIVDTLNAVSLHSGLPISVVDLDKCEMANSQLRGAIAGQGSEYVFNASGQTMKLDGLLCLFDDVGPCANAVKDSQRTKTSDHTARSLVVIWGTNQLPGHSARTHEWFVELIRKQNLGEVGLPTISII
jgi:DNA/RNA-binding domain of Phe-tRNA-synthetase-like protein